MVRTYVKGAVNPFFHEGVWRTRHFKLYDGMLSGRPVLDKTTENGVALRLWADD